MNNKTTFHRWVSLALTLLLCVLSAMAQKDTRRKAADGVPPSKGAPLAIKKADGKTKMAYALMGFDYQQNSLTNFLVQFPFTNGATFTPVIKMCDGGYDLTAGAYADGYYYAERTQTAANGIMMPVELVCYDIERNQLSTVGPLSGFTSHINDMTYDYSTGTMYAISTYENAYSNLFTIDLGNAKSKVVASLDRRFFTLACTYDGQLYGISFDGEFCKIDKNTGAVEVIGATGWHPNYYQSMEFDHTDGTLYWAANLKEGVGETDCIASVDLATGAATSVAVIGSLPQLGGLYIPFSASAKGTPAALDNFDVVADANGATKATLSWTNPTKTFDGQDLSAIKNVMIMRDHEPIATITDAQPGKPMQYVDNLGDVKGAIHHYTAYATNSVGNGAEVRTSLFIGHDIPSPVTDLQFDSPDKQNVILSWEHPTEGKMGGYVDMESLTYTVVRHPDEKVIATGLKTTTANDFITKLARYSYTVTAVNADGESEEVTTETKALGPIYTLPQSFDFTAADADDSWTVVDGNEDGYAWSFVNTMTGKAMGHQPSNTDEADDWLLGYFMPFEKDKLYRIDINYHAYSEDAVELYLVKDLNIMKKEQLISKMDIKSDNSQQHYSVVFKALESGTFNLALHAVSPMRADWVFLYNLSVREAENNNLAATALTGPGTLIQNQKSTYTVTVENQGANEVKTFTVALKDQDGAELAHKDVTTALKTGESTQVQIAWTPATTATTAVKAEVTLTGATDENADDNATDLLPVSVREGYKGTIVQLGTDSRRTSSDTPFGLANKYAAALNLYSAQELGSGSKNIVKAAWPYDASWQYKDANDLPVRVYMANTDRTNNLEGWIPENEMTLVYDGTISIPKNTKGEVAVELTTPFAYQNGKNLAVLTVVHTDQNLQSTYFYAYKSPLDENCSFYWGYRYTEEWFNFTQVGAKDYFNLTSSIILYMNDASSSGISSATADNLAGAAYAVYDLCGRKVADGVLSADGNIDAAALAHGVYVVTYTKGGKKQSMKVRI